MYNDLTTPEDRPSRIVRQARRARNESRRWSHAMLYGFLTGPIFSAIALYVLLGQQGFLQGATAMLKGAAVGFVLAFVAPLLIFRHFEIFRDLIESLRFWELVGVFLLSAVFFALGSTVVTLVFGTELLDKVPTENKLIAVFGVCLCTGGYTATGYWLAGRTATRNDSTP